MTSIDISKPLRQLTALLNVEYERCAKIEIRANRIICTFFDTDPDGNPYVNPETGGPDTWRKSYEITT